MRMRPLRYLSIVLASLLLQACDHPLQIQGEGDIIDIMGSGHGCTLEQFQAQNKACAKNTVIYAYDVNYEAVPRAGWEFVGWEGPCATNSVPPYCRLQAAANVVKQVYYSTMPATTAVFTAVGPWYPDTDGDTYGDASAESVEVVEKHLKRSVFLVKCGITNGVVTCQISSRTVTINLRWSSSIFWIS